MNKNTHELRLRLPTQLHRDLKEIAEQVDRSVNYTIIQAVAKLVAEAKGQKK